MPWPSSTFRPFLPFFTTNERLKDVRLLYAPRSTVGVLLLLLLMLMFAGAFTRKKFLLQVFV